MLSGITCVLLGERNLHASANAIVLEHGRFHSSSGHSAGYQVEIEDSTVSIRYHSSWAALAGFPSLYWFKGTISRSGKGAALDGRVLMTQPIKGFVLAWFSAVSMGLAIGMLLAISKAAEFMIITSPVFGEDLSTAGFLIGAVMILAAFGVLIVGVLRAVKRREREGLIRFCEGFAQGSPIQPGALPQ